MSEELGLGGLLLVAITLAGMSAVAWALRRWRGGVGGPREQLVRLSEHHSVQVVEFDGRRFLMGTGPDGPPVLLAELDPVPRPETVLRTVGAQRADVSA